MQTPEKIEKIEKIEKAFELYCANHKQADIAKEFKVSRSTVSGWAKDYDWKTRKDERDKKDAEKLRKSTLEGKELLLELINAGARQLIDNIKSEKKVLEPKDTGIFVDAYEKLTRPLEQPGTSCPDIQISFDVKGKPDCEVDENA